MTWYTWLEQGRSIRVSTQVIESLSKVLLLDKQERIHLYLLANQPLPADIPGYQGTVSPILQHVLDSLTFPPGSPRPEPSLLAKRGRRAGMRGGPCFSRNPCLILVLLLQYSHEIPT
ncbi:helix-turn-helix domain-containing protein [Desulfoscipio gibsoniae]|uniref:helix-turn-helix domain-containing protein n=1 Tax=Desulfoscipio gibsoniae TaxID=102134 RepID=UPI001FE22554|nr:helix-turn-helix transcriptional regulator [Desulfoscipio gibsoniae]